MENMEVRYFHLVIFHFDDVGQFTKLENTESRLVWP